MRIGDEPFSRRVGMPQIPARDANTPDVQLSDDVHGKRCESPVEHVRASVGDGTPDEYMIGDVVDTLDRRPDRGLGRAVDIPELGRGLEEAAGKIGRQRFTPDEHPHSLLVAPASVEQQSPRCRGRLHDRGALAADQRRQLPAIPRVIVRRNDDRCAGRQRQP